MENKEFPHSYKKRQFTTIYMLLPLYTGARTDGFLTLPYLCNDSSAQLWPPSQWRCTPTPRFQAISRLNRCSSMTLASFMRRRRATQYSAFATGSQLNGSSRHFPETDSKPVTIYSITLHFHQNRRGHASTCPNQFSLVS